jgi:acyltransferase-like protein
LGGVSHGRAVLEALSRISARRLARQVLAFDGVVGEAGLGTGGAWALKRLSRSARVEGQDNVPHEGPLLLVSNHPGLADAVALFAATPREDLRVIAADRPFLDALPNTSRYLLTVGKTSAGRSSVVRAAARHLRGGGAVLTFPGGSSPTLRSCPAPSRRWAAGRRAPTSLRASRPVSPSSPSW